MSGGNLYSLKNSLPERYSFLSFLFFFCFCFVSPVLMGQNNPSLKINSPETVRPLIEELTNSLNKYPVTDGLAGKTADSIKSLLSGNGYFEVVVLKEVLTEKDKTVFFISVFPGRQFSVDTIIFLTKDSISLAAENMFNGSLNGKPFNQSEIERFALNYLRDLDKSGYPFSLIELRGVEKSADTTEATCKLKFELKLNLKAFIDSVAIDENLSTSRNVILREAGIIEGSVYSSKAIEVIPRRLNKLRIFEPVPLPEYFVTSANKGILKLNLTEKNSGTADGIIGYVPGGREGEQGHVTGMINLAFINLLGTARRLAFRWQKIDRSSQDLELKYYEPRIIGYPFSAELLFQLKKQDSSYIQQKPELRIDYLADDFFTLSYTIAQETVVPVALTIPRFTVFNATTLISGFGLRYDSRDDPLSPATGMYSEAKLLYRNKRINGPAEYLSSSTARTFTQSTVEGSFSYFSSLFRGQTLAITIAGNIREGDGLEVSDLIKVGGFSTVRGYTENRYLTSHLYRGSVEYRFRFEGRGYFYPFFDFGFIKKQNEAGYLFLPGYGAGITFGSGLGLMDISFSLGKGDSFNQAKINFGIKNDF